MPINLPPEAIAAEKKYRAAKSPAEKISTLEEFLSTIPKHKGTDKLRADLRRKLSKLKATPQVKKGSGKRELTVRISREGAGQVAVVGSANVGKSALVAALTNATPGVSSVPFTTRTPMPGMMPFQDIQIQLVDIPSLNAGFVDQQWMEIVRRSDLILVVVDLQADPLQQLDEGMRLLAEQRILPLLQEDRPSDQEQYTFLPLLVLANKADSEASAEDFDIFRQLLDQDWPSLPASATTGHNLEALKQAIFERLEIIRVYSKAPGKDPDLTSPFVLKSGSTVEQLAGMVHKDFLDNLKAARVWGSAEFPGQLVGRDHVLRDGDVVELRT